ncbi:MAG: EAL domain-containing protein [Clostridia bacterium]|nr:EAL domain-containing protein [Clostridia bacterium]
MIIGVCLAELHLDLNTNYVAELSRAARACGSELIVFNTPMDFIWYQNDKKVSRSVYRAIHYDLFSALVIISGSFHDEALFDDIVREATAHGVPVISVGSPHAGCHSIVNDPVPAYKALLRHVIGEHGARDTFFISGIPDEENAEQRLKCYREVLAEFSLPFLQENLDWGYYWSRPAVSITERLIREREKMPQAIFCANDAMALSVCETLQAHGLRVPEDVIVTGFDGIPAASMVRPRLTTVRDDQAELADQTVDLIRRLAAGEAGMKQLTHVFHPVYSESCGCHDAPDSQYDALTLFHTLSAEHSHENHLYHTVERMLMQTEQQDFLRILSHALPEYSAVYLNRRYLEGAESGDYQSTEIEEALIRIPHTQAPELPVPELTHLHHNSPVSPIRSGITLVSAIHSDEAVFGYFSAQTQNLRRDSQLLKRMADVLNLVFTIQLGNRRQRNLLSHIEKSMYLDALTGLNNLKGLTRWFADFSDQKENHRKYIALSVYEISRYAFIYENYGIEETESVVQRIAQALRRVNPEALQVARISDTTFVVFDCAGSEPLLSARISRTVEEFYRTMGAYNAENDRNYFVEINAGCTTMAGGWDTVGLENLISLATGELYLNRLKARQREAVKDTFISAELYSSFSLLMEKNLFRFHFQPIVDARTGQIYAYEALMRTDSLINLNPLQVLNIARVYGRLYEVEKATLSGIMERYVQDYSAFRDAKVFINTIPGFFLNAGDCRELTDRFGSYLDCFVFELTEQDSTSDEELMRLKQFSKPGSQARIAIDDYGTGHSNMVNVLRYAPQIIKIDRALISGIEGDGNKQLFVRNTIDFAHQNGIRALAEGVETAAELETVISFGVDLIQGYYTARPAEMPIPEINPEIRQQIVEESLKAVRFDRESRTYAARNGETVQLFDLAMHKYTVLEVPAGAVVLQGTSDSPVELTVRIADNAEATLILDSASLKGEDEPAIQLGSNSRVTLVLRGNSMLRRDGIRVPGNASLLLTGDGSLTIDSSRNYSVGIGSNFNDVYGTIEIDLKGTLNVSVSGDKAVCVGGGRSGGKGLTLKRGLVSLHASGISVLGIGSAAGSADIRLPGGQLECRVQGNDAVGIGTLSGHASIVSSGEVTVQLDSERAVGLGTLNGTADLRLTGGAVQVVLHCDTGACIGNFSGEGSSLLSGATVHFIGEGNRTAGLGSVEGACDTRIEGGIISGNLLASVRRLLGNSNSRVVITGGNVRLYPESGETPVSPGGEPLKLLTPEGDTFEQTYKDKRATWNYRATRSKDGFLDVWVPADS